MSQPRVVTQVALAGLLAMLALVTLRGLDRPFGNGDEVIYAQNIREMIRSGDYSVLHWQGEVVLQRPAAPFALAAIGARLVDGEAGLRLTSALASLATLVLIYFIALRTWKRRDAAVIAVLLCAGAPSFHLFSRSLLSDPPFVLALTVAIGGTLWAQRDPRGLMLAGLGLGGAFAMKSLAAAIPFLALAPWLVVAAWQHGRQRWRSTAAAAAIFAAVAAPFYLIGAARFGARFFREHFGYSLFARARGDLAVGDHSDIFTYARHLFEVDGALVTSWLVFAVVGALVIARRFHDRDLAVIGGYALFVFIALSLVGTRLPHYLLPLYPAAALAAAGIYARFADRSQALKSSPLYGIAGPLLAAALLLAGIAREGPEKHFLPAPAAPEVGRAAALATTPEEPVHAFEWYATAFAYYADRDLKIVTANQRFFAIVDDVDFFHAAGVAVLAPPPPAPPGSSIVVYGPTPAIRATPWLREQKVLHEVGGLALVRAQVVDSGQ